MTLHYQVTADYSFSKGKPSLIGLSLNSTSAACTNWPIPGSLKKFTSNSRIFKSQKDARSYITYLMGRYPKNSIPFPVLDKGQNELFAGEQNENI